MERKNLSVRMEEELLLKLHEIAKYEGRSASQQVVILIRRMVEAYEEKRGVIIVTPKSTEMQGDA